MQRYKLILEYDGTPFSGWQSQPDGKGVQDALERAIAAVDGGLRRTSVAGRTDAGVHATAQVAHADLEKDWTPYRLREAVNAWLRETGGVCLLEAIPVPEAFDARFSAQWRRYLYRIKMRRGPLALDDKRAWGVFYPLDIDAMRAAARYLVGTYDFTTFRDTRCQAKSPIRTLDVFDLSLVDTATGPELHTTIEAKSFLHKQVRSMVGSLVDVGRGLWPVERLKSALDAKDRRACGEVAPPWGLYLTAVGYGDGPNTSDPD